MSGKAQSHILLLGATGKTGRLLLIDILSKGFSVSAMARKPSVLNDISQSDGLSVVKGDPTDRDSMTAALSTALANAGSLPVIIVSTLGQTRASGSPWSATTSPAMFMTHAIQALLSAIMGLSVVDQSRIQKLVVMSMFGAGHSFDNLHFLIKPVMKHSNMLQTVEDHNGVDTAVKGQSSVGWTMVRPSKLRDGAAMPVIVRNDVGTGEGWLPSSVTRGTVVKFIADCLTSDEYISKTPVITN